MRPLPLLIAWTVVVSFAGALAVKALDAQGAASVVNYAILVACVLLVTVGDRERFWG